MTGSVGGEALRAMVRDVLREVLPSVPAGPAPAAGPAPTRPGQPQPPSQAARRPGRLHRAGRVEAVETVSVRTDQELAAFVTRLLHLFENPKHRDDLRAGRLRFRLAEAGVAGSARPAHRIEKGAVTEAAVRDAARAGARLVLGRRAVLTPLARDRARSAGVEIEKER